ncbi:hypothetical protein FGADI_6167 [Fusarium gaditjirri]|uniref:Uncharacterized protein n=1 Tax=Fusarium gaditjirri TaxID=282569 RepID=A0A8H4WWP7_9HYPO|nr:hypothetical protein FGADI_6167 [Fusarium gaditjirri]
MTTSNRCTEFPAPGLRNPFRYVTGHDINGESTFLLTDHGDHHAVMLDGAGAQSIMYSSNSNPVELTGNVDLEFARMNRPSLHIPKGCVVRMVDFAPGGESNMHRALSLGIGTVCEGEVELSLSDDGKVNRVLRPGDVIVNRCAMHRWRNTSNEKSARMLFVMLDVEPVFVNHKALEFDMGELMKEYGDYKEGEGANKKAPNYRRRQLDKAKNRPLSLLPGNPISKQTMAIYVITGISRGLGYELTRQLSNDHRNTIVGIVRDKPATITKISQDAELSRRSNIHVIQADLTNYNALKDAASEIAKLTGGSIDYLIANAAYVSKFDTFEPLGVLGNTPKELEEDLKMLFDVNVVANIHLFNLFIPLLLRGKEKKAVTISTGLADLDFTNNFEYDVTPLYSISKAAMNMAVAKFNAQYKKDGVLFMSVCPGMVDVGQFDHASPQQLESMGGMMAKFKEYAPNFGGPAKAEAAVSDMRAVWEKATIEDGYGGAYLSQYGNKQWL